MYVTYIKSKKDTMCMLHISRVRRIPCVCYIYQELEGYHVYVTYIKSKKDTMCMLHIS